MKDYKFHEKVIDAVTVRLKELDIDLYLIITAEGCDPVTELIPGVDTIGASAFLFFKEGKRVAVASQIDAQGLEESSLFDHVVRYESYDRTLADIIRESTPRRIALDYSEEVPFCDGLTIGKYEKFIESVKEMAFETCSADMFIPQIQKEMKEGIR